MKEQWGFFLRIVLNPWVIITGIVIYLLMNFSPEDGSSLSVVNNIFIWLTSAVFGGIISKLWIDQVEEKVIVSRGKAAVRNLNLLLNNISSFEKRINSYKDKISYKEQSEDTIMSYFEEIEDRCNVLQEEVLNSIENWTDILPKANIQSQIGIITAIKGEKEELEIDIEKLHEKVKENKGKSEEERKELENELSVKSQELSKLKKELRGKEYKFAGSIVGRDINAETLDTNYNIDISSKIEVKKCIECDKSYFPTISSFDNGKCSECSTVTLMTL